MASKVLLIAGVGKSGSTLIGALLGQLPGYQNVGEVISIEHAGREGHRCGCGSTVGRCSFWGPIVTDSIGGIAGLDTAEWGRLHTGRFWSQDRRQNRSSSEDGQFRQLKSLYRSLMARTDASVIVDGSKSFRYARVLSEMPDLQLFVLHLVRDPRAVEHSKSKLLSGGHWKFNRTSVAYNSVQWLGLNLLLESLRVSLGPRYLRLRYEDFIRSPADRIADVAQWVSGSRAHPPIDSEGGVVLGPNHTLGGSDVRLETGRVVLAIRDAWKDQMPGFKNALVTLLTFPLLLRYRYPVLITKSVAKRASAI